MQLCQRSENLVQVTVCRPGCSDSVYRRHLDEVLWARAEYWIKKLHVPTLPSHPPDVCRLIALLAKWLPFGSVFASVRAISNAWPTSSRIARLDGSCPFCRRGPDGLLHCLASCSTVRDARSRMFQPIRGPVDPLDLLLVPLMPPTTASQRARFFSIGLFLDGLYCARAALVHRTLGEPCLMALLPGRLRQIGRSHGQLAQRIAHVCDLTS